MPDRFELDISAMEIGDSLRVSDLVVSKASRSSTDPEVVLASVIQPRVEEEPESRRGRRVLEGEEGVEGEEGEGAEAGESAPEGDAGDESPSEE